MTTRLYAHPPRGITHTRGGIATDTPPEALLRIITREDA